MVCLIITDYILRQSGLGDDFVTNYTTINFLLYMDDLKLYVSSEKTINSLVKTVFFSSDIHKDIGIEL